MLPETMTALIKSRMANNTDPTLDASILLEANFAQTRRERGDFLPWFLVKDTRYDGGLAVAAGAERGPLPCDFLREYEESKYCAFVESSTTADAWTGLVKKQYGQALELHPGVGIPQTYDIIGKHMYFRPASQDGNNLRLMYYASDAEIVEGQENRWMTWADDLILAETGVVMASQYVVMPALEQAFRAQAAEALRRLMVEHTARVEAGHMRTMGED